MTPASPPDPLPEVTGPRCDYPWSPDGGDGTFRNPILCADYSDPDVIRQGDDFYLTASSFNCTPGLPILHSHDLVNWTIVGHAVKNLPHPRYAEVQHGCGIWAPAIRWHAGRFWIFFPTPDEGIFLVTAEDPRGPWSEPHLLLAGKGLIDPCPLWDDDGQVFLVHAYARSRCGLSDILRVRPMGADGLRVLGEGQVVFHRPEHHPTIEGPKFLKRDGWYYILAPAGGVASGWQVALRSRNIYGPYEDKIVLERGGTAVNGPHQGALVDAPDGAWWFIHFQDAGVYGRIVHLQPVRWQDGWPMVGEDQDGNGVGEPVQRWRLPLTDRRWSHAIPQTSDEFDSCDLGRQWQWQANHQDEWWTLTERKGWLRLQAQPVADADLSRAANLLSQKLPAKSFVAETLLTLAPGEPGDEAGLAVTGRRYIAVAIRRSASNNQIVLREDGTDNIVCTTTSDTMTLRVRMRDGGVCDFQFSTGRGRFEAIPETFQAVAGAWIGAKVGIYSLTRSKASSGYADFDYFRFSGTDDR